MPSKTEEYLALAQRTANGLTRYWESWTDYLTTASRLYKYPFADQLMIYAQRPDATACAEFDIWRNRMNRYVRRGSKGIALLDESSGFPRLHYVFDVSDTGVRRNSRDPEVWQLGPDLVQPVSEMLSKTYGISGERVSQQLADVAGKLVADYWDNNGGDIRAIVDGSLLMDYDEAGVEMQFKSAAAISVTYTLLERCGFEPAGWFDKDDFQAIHDFSTPDAVFALGAAVSDMSREVLRNIERTVKTTIRRRNVERSQYEYEQQERDLLDHRGLSAPEPDPAPAGENTGQVRATAPDLPDEASPGAVQLDASVGNSVSAPVGGGANRREPDAADKYRARVVFVGSEVDDVDVIRLVEESGAYVCADRFCYGSLPGRDEIILNDEEDVVKQVCRQVQGRAQCPRYWDMAKMTGRRDYVADLAKEYGADGIIYEQMKFCDPWAYERMIGTIVLRDEHGYPVLAVDRPYSIGSSGQMRTRVQAFVESIEIKKIQGGKK